MPAFSGLFAPYWRSDARGAIVGLSRFNTNAHLARATLEAICYQSRDVAEAMEQDSGVHLEVLKVDGGVTANDLCMQLQADILGVPVSRPVVAETTALGAAYAAGLAVGFWSNTDELRANWNESKRWAPHVDRRAAGRRLRRVEEGGAAHARLGRRRLTDSNREDVVRDAALSPAARADAIARMAERELDVLVVGGGVVGAGSALDAVTRGLSTAIVEARDWASGTSSRSSKLIHGGLRYLEMLDFGLVREALQRARAAARPASRRTWCGRCRSSTRCSTGSGSGPTSGPGSLLYDAMAYASGTAQRAAAPPAPDPQAARCARPRACARTR